MYVPCARAKRVHSISATHVHFLMVPLLCSAACPAQITANQKTQVPGVTWQENYTGGFSLALKLCLMSVAHFSENRVLKDRQNAWMVQSSPLLPAIGQSMSASMLEKKSGGENRVGWLTKIAVCLLGQECQVCHLSSCIFTGVVWGVLVLFYILYGSTVDFR